MKGDGDGDGDGRGAVVGTGVIHAKVVLPSAILDAVL